MKCFLETRKGGARENKGERIGIVLVFFEISVNCKTWKKKG
jgi:hypothetical protein